MKIGATTIPLAGWGVDPRRPEQARAQRLAAMRQLVEGYGLSAVELNLDLGIIFPQVFDEGFYAAVAGLQQELSFTCTAHLPFLWLDPSSLNEPVRQASVGSLCQALELARAVDVTTYVLHLWGFTTIQIALLLADPAQRQAILGGVVAQVGRSLDEVCQVLDPRDLCVENLEAPPFDMVLPLVERAGASICLDVGHLAYEQGDALEFLARHGERVREVHLHDFVHTSEGGRTRTHDHLPLGRGEMDTAALLRRLEEMGFAGAVILEVNSKADLEESLERVACCVSRVSWHNRRNTQHVTRTT
jgi:sugar phosphate isomerase/epimerase